MQEAVIAECVIDALEDGDSAEELVPGADEIVARDSDKEWHKPSTWRASLAKYTKEMWIKAIKFETIVNNMLQQTKWD